MLTRDGIKLKGKVKLELFNKYGELKETNTKNLVVTAGLDWIASTIAAGSGTAMSHMAVGTDVTGEVVGDTTLGSELARAVITDTQSNVVASDVQYTAVFGGGVGTGALVEAGIFNSPTAGVMLARTTFGVINKDSDDSMQITWTITFASS